MVSLFLEILISLTCSAVARPMRKQRPSTSVSPAVMHSEPGTEKLKAL